MIFMWVLQIRERGWFPSPKCDGDPDGMIDQRLSQHLIRRASRGLLVSTVAVQAASATLEADFVTSRGTVTVELEYGKSPKAVANLITLAQGTRSWIDSVTGAVRREPFYDGLLFHEVVNTTSVKLAGTGSSSGDGTDDAGYTFQDEFDDTLTHGPYVLSMAGDGPNTNGGRVYFTGNVAMPDRDRHDPVFGKIPGASSRAVVDAILANGAGTTTVLAVNIRRTDPAAIAFDEKAVPLPEVTAINGPLQVQPGAEVRLLFAQPAISILRATTSSDLLSWAPRFHRFVSIDDGLPGPSQVIDDTTRASAFYQISSVRYPLSPAAGGPSGFANRTLTLEGPGIGTLIYQFDLTGQAGTYQNVVFPGEPPFFSGAFQVRSEVTPVYEPNRFKILLHADGLGGSPFNLIRGGWDETGSGTLSGRHETRLMNESMTPVFDEKGSVELNRP